MIRTGILNQEVQRERAINMLSKQAIEEYQKIMKKEFGQDITVAEAEEQGTRLLRLFEILVKVDQREKQK